VYSSKATLQSKTPKAKATANRKQLVWGVNRNPTISILNAALTDSSHALSAHCSIYRVPTRPSAAKIHPMVHYYRSFGKKKKTSRSSEKSASAMFSRSLSAARVLY